MVMGLPGSGKNYFASRLSGHIKAVHLENDVIRKDLHKMGNYSKEDKMEVYRELCRRAEDLLKQGESVVLDATFHLSEYRSLFYRLSSDYNVPVVSILVEVDESLVKKRLEQPRPKSEADYGVYLKLKEDFDPVLHPFLSVSSGDSNLEEMLHRAVNYIKTGE